ncbi:unnamed protein product [Calypogeia fissa]
MGKGARKNIILNYRLLSSTAARKHFRTSTCNMVLLNRDRRNKKALELQIRNAIHSLPCNYGEQTRATCF